MSKSMKKKNVKSASLPMPASAPVSAPVILDSLDLASLDLTVPLPHPSASVREIHCLHKLEYLTGPERVRFMEGAWRILVPDGKMTVVVCYWTSSRAIQDPLLQWPPLCEQSFLYFNAGWRAAQQLAPLRCNFGFSYGYVPDQETATRNQETQSFWIKHYVGAVLDMQVALTKEEMPTEPAATIATSTLAASAKP